MSEAVVHPNGDIAVDITISLSAKADQHLNTSMTGGCITYTEWPCLAWMIFRAPNYSLLSSHKYSLVRFYSTHFAYLIRLRLFFTYMQPRTLLIYSS
jgi:hypothetical protein